MLSVIKFFANPDDRKRESSPVISRTLCKITLISSEYRGEMPRDGEWWWVRIVQETFAKGSKSKSDNLSGVFVVEPICVVDRSILRLIAGMFTQKIEENVLIIRPKQNLELPWIMPKQHRDILRKKYGVLSVIVDLSPGDYGEVLDEQQRHPPLDNEADLTVDSTED